MKRIPIVTNDFDGVVPNPFKLFQKKPPRKFGAALYTA